ncbi:MAG: Na+/H+ antiporter subunit D [Cellulosimicrobium funkei]|uniref:Na+/H+ antiporter subunit D n=1 Tax=Cellulosimicrobium cellulans TaxID=1710 RepID=A0AAV5P3A7_CELCE|nr:Na+/H+ antiporter subunit D [Cellulosimicrobium cellulans]QDP74570.1 Na+/H+ antiporter subunit D [Cellulosimicrobium cellulans]GLY55800.1 Na+/H+ antiporter subunit D [Cellulosimicrobium cellulans]
MSLTAAALVPLPVVLPLVAAGLALALWRHPRAQRIITVAALALVLAASVGLLVAADSGPIVVDVGGWAAPVGIDLVADRLSSLMLVVSSFVMLCVLLYSLAQGVADGDEEAPVAIYHPTFMVLAAGVFNAFLSGDLFNLYVGFEIFLAASYVLLTLGGTGERIRAGSIYVVVALLSSIVFLVAIALTYAATGTVNLAQLSERYAEIDPGTALAIQLLLLLAFGIKAAIFPLSAWLPDSYPTAPAPVTAVFAGLLTKVGVYAIIRTQTLLFPEDSVVDDVLMWLALLTMVVGILGAVAQNDIKRLLSFTLVSHIGYMIFGIALASEPGMAAAIFYVVHHITVQTTLFLVVGLVERRGGSTSLDRLGGLAKLAPGLAILFFIPAMNLAGIPPLSGFLGKVGLLEEGVAQGTPLTWALVVGSVVTSLLTLYAIVKAWNKAFWQTAPVEIPADARLPRGMVGPATALVAFGLALTVVAGPLYSYTERAAATLLDGYTYVDAVFPGDSDRGQGESNEVATGESDGTEPAGTEPAGTEPAGTDGGADG